MTYTVYIAGPMTGYPEYNYPAFFAMDDLIARKRPAWKTINPAFNFDGDKTLPYSTYLREAVKQVASADGIVLLNGWKTSRGANLEVRIAQTLGMDFWTQKLDAYIPHEGAYMNDPLSLETPVQEAYRLVHGDRNKAYGHPLDDFSRTGRLWAAILDIQEVTPDQVALCMAAVKISRQVNSPRRDNLVDLAGYAETAHMVIEERDRRSA